MTAPKIDTISMEVRAYNKGEALEVAHKCNQNMCDGKFSYFLTERLAFNQYLVVLAHNEDETLEAKIDFTNETVITNPIGVIL